MGTVISSADQALLFPKVFDKIAEDIKNGVTVLPAKRPIDVDALITECDGIMVDGFIANFVDTDDTKTMVIVVEKGLVYSFSKADVSRISLGEWETKLKDLDGVERTIMFYKRVPVEREDLP